MLDWVHHERVGAERERAHIMHQLRAAAIVAKAPNTGKVIGYVADFVEALPLSQPGAASPPPVLPPPPVEMREVPYTGGL